MSVMFILIGCSFLMAVGFLIAFIWSVKSGQMEDDYTPSVRILYDDFERESSAQNKQENKEEININK
ncbi:MAG: cbb3-type cytochrome oxidase assembly protein CcoS [Bacteroidia bacterium]|nr:cbb3-type cytochrome oxidase assembly protein CcoS [Bacteroidia bacterium]MCC7532316.1 cbb3-type cytochrome oxidase assembly protein CcoS [Bacteroidia bacterium]